MSKSQPIELAQSPDLRGSWIALQRAAMRARELAARTGTALIVLRHGTVEHEYPQSAPATQRVQESTVQYGKSE